MNKKLISVAVLAGLASTASAVNVDSDGLGQLLLYPYYSATEGRATNISVVNTTNQTKAVKVRFNEGGNSWEVKDFNVYLSPYDVWVAGVTMDKEGKVPMIYTQDTTCTMPQVFDYETANADPDLLKAQSFDTRNIDAFAATSGENTNIAAEDRIKEGYIEVIEMARIVGDGNMAAPYGDVARLGADGVDFVGAIEHNPATGKPNDCQYVLDAWQPGITVPPAGQNNLGRWTIDSVGNGFGITGPRPEIRFPMGGLFGSADIINVPASTNRSYDAVAINNVYWAALHSRPGTAYPDLGGNFINQGQLRNSNDGGTVQFPTPLPVNQIVADFFDVPMGAFTTGPGVTQKFIYNIAGALGSDARARSAGLATIKAITTVLQASRVMNQFTSDVNLGAMSDWVVTFPTKHEFVNPRTTADGGRVGREGYKSAAPGAQPLAPFTTGFDVPVALVGYDREEQFIRLPLQFSPSPANVMPYETNVISFTEKSVLESFYGANAPAQGTKDGWAILQFADTLVPTGRFRLCEDVNGNAQGNGPKCMTGLPVVGFNTTMLFNGVKSYSTLNNHKYSRTLSR